MEDVGDNTAAAASVKTRLRIVRLADHQGFAWEGLAITGQAPDIAEVAKILDVPRDNIQRGEPTQSSVAVKSAKRPEADATATEKIVVKPEPSDEIGAMRAWRNTTGDRSIKAELQSVEGDSVALKKEDNTVLRIPLEKLHKDDQETVRSFVKENSKRELVKAVRSFFETDFGDTSARVAEKEKTEATKLCNQFKGRETRLIFPIRDVRKAQGMIRGPGIHEAHPAGDDEYQLILKVPEVPKNTFVDLGEAFGNGGERSLIIKLTKAEALGIGPSSRLVMQGKIRLLFSHGPYSEFGAVISWRPAQGDSYNGRKVSLALDELKTKIENQPQRPAAGADAKDAENKNP